MIYSKVFEEKNKIPAIHLECRDSFVSLQLFDGDAEGAAIYMDVAAEVAQDGHSYVITFLAEYAAIDGMRIVDDELQRVFLFRISQRQACIGVSAEDVQCLVNDV